MLGKIQLIMTAQIRLCAMWHYIAKILSLCYENT